MSDRHRSARFIWSACTVFLLASAACGARAHVINKDDQEWSESKPIDLVFQWISRRTRTRYVLDPDLSGLGVVTKRPESPEDLRDRLERDYRLKYVRHPDGTVHVDPGAPEAFYRQFEIGDRLSL